MIYWLKCVGDSFAVSINIVKKDKYAIVVGGFVMGCDFVLVVAIKVLVYDLFDFKVQISKYL